MDSELGNRDGKMGASSQIPFFIHSQIQKKKKK